ncbi:MAG TPA: glycosyltransferase family 4 protein [Candidatus Eisenbacteria bacterium]|nr:glycosyltransferase family 4 protein [Candidatus Eisenbacteria bacterium]
MRILFLTSRLPSPPVGGDRFRVFHLLRTAAEAGHRIDLVSFDDGRSDPSALDPLKRFTSSYEIVSQPKWVSWMRAASALPTKLPLQAAYYRSDEMSRRVSRAFDRNAPDVVYTHLFRMAPYALAERRRRDARWILDLTDVISGGIERSLPYRRGPQQWLYREEGRRIARYEAEVAPRFDDCWVISDAEARALGAIAPEASIRVVPNGFEPERNIVAPARERASLLFFGNHDVLHNRDAARFLATEILPRVREAIPETTLDIAGKGADALGAWVRRPGVRVLGFVPDLDRELRRASLFVAPHRFAAGVQNKVLQALSAGTPVVTTPVVQQGLAPAPDDVLRVADGAPALADQVVALLRDPREAARLGERGRVWACSRFNWRESLAAFEEGRPALAPDSGAPGAAKVAVAGARA